MSAKSAAHPASHSQHLFTRKVFLVAVVLIAVMFFMTVAYYPLIFSSERSTSDALSSPSTEIR